MPVTISGGFITTATGELFKIQLPDLLPDWLLPQYSTYIMSTGIYRTYTVQYCKQYILNICTELNVEE